MAPKSKQDRPATVEEVEEILRKVPKVKLPQRLIREIITCLQVGKTRRQDPEGVFIHSGTLTKGSNDRDPPVQICFSFDTTGSMNAYISDVRNQITSLVSHLLTHIPGIQISIAAHGDYGDEKSSYVVKAKDFSNSVDALQKFIKDECGPTAGGDHPECYELVLHKMQELTWAATSAKALVMIGDAPPHNEQKYKGLGKKFIDWKKEAAWYAGLGIHLYGVKCGNSKETFYDKIAEMTGATVINIAQIDLMPELFTELCFREQQRWALAYHPLPAWNVRAISNPKLALLNVCGSCTLAEPTFHETVGVTKQRILSLCRRLAREEQGEFVLQMALYCRTQLYLRSVSNFLTCVAADIPNCVPHLKTYFNHIVKLPTDMLEVAKMYVSQQEAPTQIHLPQSLRKVFSRKFGEFSEYQLSKHKKKETLMPDGSWQTTSAKSRAKADSKANGKGKGKGKPEEDEEKVEEEEKKALVLSMKFLIRLCHISEPHEMVMKILGKHYPETQEEFVDSGLPGEFDPARSWERLKLKEALTFQTQLSKKGNTKESWEELIDKNGLPFMALMRNLRNILGAGLAEKYHDKLLQRLQDKKQVTESMQMPHRFLTAYLAVDAAATGKSFGQGGGKAKGKGKRRRQPAADEGDGVEGGQELLPADLAAKYKKALDNAVQLAVEARLGPLQGRTVVLCDVSGSMRYNEFAKNAKGIAGVTSAADLAILLGLLLFHMSKDEEHCKVVLFSDGAPKPLELQKGVGVLTQFTAAKEKVDGMAKTTDLPMQWLRETLATFPADRVVLFSDMLLGLRRNHAGGGAQLQELLTKHREKKQGDCALVCVDLFGSGATTGLDLSGDSNPNDILLSGFSDHMLAYIANPSFQAQVADVEQILQKLQAEEEEKARNKGKRGDKPTAVEAQEGAPA